MSTNSSPMYLIVSAKSRGRLVANRFFPITPDTTQAECKAIVDRFVTYLMAERILRADQPKFLEGSEVWTGILRDEPSPRALDLTGFTKFLLPLPAGLPPVELPGDDA
jgi:hypothetical protein